MNLEEQCDPNKNPHFAAMLDGIAFLYRGIEPKPFKNPATQNVSGALLGREKNEVVLVLFPNLGTSMLEHKRETAEVVTYLGPVNQTESPTKLKYKFQNDRLPTRTSESDIVNEYAPGFTFSTIGPGINGRFHGYHNSDPVNPVALLIRKQF